MLRGANKIHKLPIMKLWSVPELTCAVRDGNVAIVREFALSPPECPLHAPPEEWNMAGYNLLTTALQNKHYEIADLLLTKVTEVNNSGKLFVQTPLHYAAADNRQELAHLLIKLNADVDAVDEHDMTPLHRAVISENLEIVQMLLAYGADTQGWLDIILRLSPYQYACKCSKPEILEAFLMHGNDPNTVFEDTNNLICPRNSSPLHMTIINGNYRTTQLLLSYGANVDHLNRNNESALYLAVKDSNEAIVKLLLDYQATVDVRSKFGWTPLHLAVREGQEEIAAMLLAHGASPSLADRDGKIALQLAVENRQPRIIDLLLKPEYQPGEESSRSAFKQAVLENGLNGEVYKCFVKKDFFLRFEEICEVAFEAVKRGYFHIVETLLKYTNEIEKEDLLLEAKSDNGRTLLHCAVQNKNNDIVRLLISRNANIHSQDDDGHPPIVYAIAEDADDIIKTLVAKSDGMKNSLLLHTVVQTKQKQRVVQLLELLLKNGVDVNEADLELGNMTVLHLICREQMDKDAEIVKLLLHYGADVNAAASDGSTALHILASRNDSQDVLRILLSHNPNLEAQDAQGCTALHVAASKARLSNIRALVNADASINATDNHGMTPLTIAAEVKRSLPPRDESIPVELFVPSRFETEADASLNLLRREAVKLEVAGTRLVEANVKYLDNVVDEDFRMKCEEELRLIEKRSIHKKVSLKDVLVRNIRKVVRYMSEETAKKCLEKTSFSNIYPIYGNLLDIAIVQIMREFAINKAKSAIPVLTGYGLPDPCTETILVHLTNHELKNLTIAPNI